MNLSVSQFWKDRAAGLPLGPWWLVQDAAIRVKVYEGGEDLTLAEWVQLPAAARALIEQQYERAA